MADFRALVEDLFHISVPQAELEVTKEGKVLLDHLEEDLRAVVENELRNLPHIVEEVVDSVIRQKPVDPPAPAASNENDAEQKAPEGDK